MAQANPVPEPHADTHTVAPALDCERLDCYRIAVEFQVLAAGIGRKPRLGSLRDQLDRASVSIVLNIAEGAGRTTGPDKAHFFAIARGSATESAAVMDLLLARGFVGPAEYRRCRALLVRIVQMTTGLMSRHGAVRSAAP
jgi:four helix bundle protein